MKIIESPRDGMQGMKKIISTENKAKYIFIRLRSIEQIWVKASLCRKDKN
jgi:hypothetical protein